VIVRTVGDCTLGDYTPYKQYRGSILRYARTPPLQILKTFSLIILHQLIQWYMSSTAETDCSRNLRITETTKIIYLFWTRTLRVGYW